MLRVSEVDKLSAREIKQHLTAANIDYGDCFEKAELIRRLQKYLEKESSEKALKAKASANHAYARGGYAVAVRHYQEGLALCADQGSELAAQMRSNQSLAFFRMGQLLLARRAAEECVAHAPWFAKGYLRLGNAAAEQGDHTAAVAALEKGMAVLRERAQKEEEERQTQKKTSEGGAEVGGEMQQQGEGGGEGGERGKEGGGAEGGDGEEKGKKGTGGATEKLSGEMGESLRVSLAAAARAGRKEGESSFGGGAEKFGGRVGIGCALLEVVSEDLIVELMGSYLSPAEICRVARTCRVLRGVCVSGQERTGKLWQAVCERVWPGPSASHASSTCAGSSSQSTDWRLLCVERTNIDHRWAQGLTSSKISVLKADHAPVFNVCMRGDIVASAEDSRVRIWDLRSRSSDKSLDCNTAGHRMVLGLWLDPVHDRALSGGADGDIRVWDLTTGGCTRVLTGHQASICSLVATDEIIVSTSFDGSSKVWSWTGRAEQTLLGHQGHVCGLSLQEGDERKCWTGADDGLVKLWDMDTAACLETLPQQGGSVWCVKAEAAELLTGCTDASVRLFDPRSSQEIAHLLGHREAVAGLVSDEDKIITSAFDSTVRVWDRRTNRCRSVLSMPHGHAFHSHRRCSRLAMSDSKVVVGSIDGCIYVIDVY